MSKNLSNKKMLRKSAVAVALVLVLTMTFTGLALPATNAHTPAWNIPTIAYLSVTPNPIGVGQEASIGFWLDKAPPTAVSDAMGDLYEFTVDVIDPNGVNKTLGPFTSSCEGGAYTAYTPTTAGNYTFMMKFAGQTLEGRNQPPPGQGAFMKVEYIGDYMMPSTSNTVTLVVQQDPIPWTPVSPLPTSYWEFPVYGNNREWSTISGNWLGFGTQDFSIAGGYNATGNFNPYTTAPNTAHIMWTTPYALGGQVGGDFEGNGNYLYYNNYLPATFQPIIINGILYTNWQDSASGIQGFKAIDLYSGEELWFHDTTTGIEENTIEQLRCGQTLFFDKQEEFGMVPYLWTQTGTAFGLIMEGFPTNALKYSMYNANTGDKILDIVGGYPFSTWMNTRQGPSFLMQDDNGNLIGYYLNCTYLIPGNEFSPVLEASLSMWNSTLCIENYALNVTFQDNVIRFWAPPQGASIPFEYGIQWSTPIDPSMELYQLASGNVVICCSDPGKWTQGYPTGVVDVGYNALTGEKLWTANRTDEAREYLFSGCSSDGMYTSFTRATKTWTAYSVTTGEELWESTPLEGNSWSSYGANSEMAYGCMYTWDFGGYIFCINATTGKEIWSWNTGTAGYDNPYGVWPFYGNTVTIADGKVYAPAGKILTPPYYKGAHTYCVNATTGEQVWDVLGWNCYAPPAVVGGYMTMCNAYDNQIYCYGKGASQTTVGAQAFGTDIVISGSITDISTGASQRATAANFPNGLPCVSDVSQSAFMEYVYMQQPKPTNATGVPVVLSVIDSNGNYRTIGTTTSDASGKYAFTWTPDITGDYTVIANFVGTGSYYASSDEAFFTATEQAPTATPLSTQGPSAADLYFIPAIIGVIIAIIVVGAVLALLVTKKP